MTNTWEAVRDVFATKTNALDASTVSSFRYCVNKIGQRRSVTFDGHTRSTGILPVVSTATATPKNHPINPRTPPTIPQFANLILDGEKRDGKGSIMDKVSVASEARRVMSRAAATNQYLDATGAIIAHYEYDAFGNVVNYTEAATDQASSFRHRFSTKQQDDESGFLYYGFRCYVQLTESWPSRDPIEESGGLNLFGFLADYHAAIDFFTIGIVKFKEGYGL